MTSKGFGLGLGLLTLPKSRFFSITILRNLRYRNGTIDAYLDDTPIAEYVRTAIDVKCQLRLVGSGFGEDAYGIGLPRNSLLKARF